MLNKIKSLYIIKNIFFHLSDIIKLKLLKHTKKYQKIIGIKIINYRIYSGKYTIFKTNNKITREYNEINNKLIFEGEYLNGERNGKGREYDLDILAFQGEYINGQKNGRGIEFYDDGTIKFEGYYLNGKRWNGNIYDKISYTVSQIKEGKGNIKEYDNDNNLIFEGEYFDGLRNGKGKEYNKNRKLIFDGEYLFGKRWNGFGYDINKNIIYELKNGKGNVKEYKASGILIFEGEYSNGLINGKGKEYNVYGKLEYEGEYYYGRRNGKGKEYNYNGDLIFEGEYYYNKKIKGREYINGYLEYEGEFINDKKFTGNGYDKNGNIIYKLNKGSGKVKYYYSSYNLAFEGEYLNGKKMEKGKNIIEILY